MAIPKAQLPELGDRVQDRITGIRGIVVGMTDWLYLCRTCVVQPEGLVEGKPLDTRSVDEGQLKVVNKGVHKPLYPQPVVGGPTPAPDRTGGPHREVLTARDIARRDLGGR